MTATAHLSEIEECMYSRMTDQYYAREAPLPLDMVACCRLVRAATAAARRAVETVLREFFSKQDDGWHQKRCDEELELYHERSAKASASAQEMWRKRNANASADAMRTHMPTHSEGNANQKPVTSNQGKSKSTARKRATPLPEGFAISEAVYAWAAEKGHQHLGEHFDAFVSKAKAKGYTYVDWDQALMNAIREDWVGLTAKAGNGKQTPADKRARVAAEMYAHRDKRDDAIDGTAERLD